MPNGNVTIEAPRPPMRYIETYFGFSFNSSDSSIELMLVIMLIMLVVVLALRYGALR